MIAGYLIVDDVSVRDWQIQTPQWSLAKSFDTHGPIGPWIVTPDELGDPHALGIRTLVNGELRQRSNTDQLIFDCFRQVEILSQACTLEPGDVIATGTPSGIAAAMAGPAVAEARRPASASRSTASARSRTRSSRSRSAGERALAA